MLVLPLFLCTLSVLGENLKACWDVLLKKSSDVRFICRRHHDEGVMKAGKTVNSVALYYVRGESSYFGYLAYSSPYSNDCVSSYSGTCIKTSISIKIFIGV
ncbi:hypothetical protein F5Y13DRAFT_157280 [Hypoxylon sp. FL1857]|nr:hypothetical protein F5Y13DRAFT_157280 [Hypoxylon sp. FL1857]